MTQLGMDHGDNPSVDGDSAMSPSKMSSGSRLLKNGIVIVPKNETIQDRRVI
jgi:hypothetical protein